MPLHHKAFLLLRAIAKRAQTVLFNELIISECSVLVGFCKQSRTRVNAEETIGTP